jgi:hypothetical protein
VWASLLLGSRRKIIHQLARIQGELSRHTFTRIGSLYEDSEAPQCHRFYVGPISPPVVLERHRINKGPWAKARGQMADLMTERLQEIVSDPEKIRSDRIFNGREESNFDVEKFRALYEAILHLVMNVQLLDDWEQLFCISHPDLTPRNILVGYEDPECIVGIIDWEGTRIQPWVCPSPVVLWSFPEH